MSINAKSLHHHAGRPVNCRQHLPSDFCDPWFQWMAIWVYFSFICASNRHHSLIGFFDRVYIRISLGNWILISFYEKYMYSTVINSSQHPCNIIPCDKSSLNRTPNWILIPLYNAMQDWLMTASNTGVKSQQCAVTDTLQVCPQLKTTWGPRVKANNGTPKCGKMVPYPWLKVWSRV